MFETLEALAYRFVQLPENTINLVFLAEMAAGAVLAFLSPGVSKLARVPYFAVSWLIMLLGISSLFIWWLAAYAVMYGLLWGLIGASMIAYLMMGYFFAIVAMARSRDAFGNNIGALLAFVPLLNLALLFAPGSVQEDDDDEMRMPAFFRGGTGIVLGLVFLAGVFAVNWAFEQWNPGEEEVAQEETQIYPEERLQSSLAEPAKDIPAGELGARLKEMVSAASLPQQIDAITLLTKMEAKGNVLHYRYDTSSSAATLSDSVRIDRYDMTCGPPKGYALVKAGAVFEYVYHRADGSVLGRVKITREDCDNWRASAYPSTEFLLQSRGVEKALQSLAADPRIRMEDNGPVRMVSLEADGKILRYMLMVRGGPAPAKAVLQDSAIGSMCLSPEMRRLLKAGATIQFVYKKPDGEVLQLINVTEFACETRAQTGAETVAAALKEQSLEQVLAGLQSRQRGRVRIDEITELESIEAKGRVLYTTYALDTDDEKLKDFMQGHVGEFACTSPGPATLLKAGATLEYHYVRARDGKKLGQLKYTIKDCPKQD